MAEVGEKRANGDEGEVSESKKLKTTHFATSEQFIHNLCRVKVEVPRTAEQKILFCRREDKIVDVWKGMVKHNILACPVIQKTKNKYYGFVDLGDIVTHIVRDFGSKALDKVENWWELCENSEDIQQVTVNDVMKTPLTRRNPFHPVCEHYSLFSATELMAREPQLHRVPVLNNREDRRLVNIITQSQLMQIFHANIDTMGDKANKPVSDMAYTRGVISVKEDSLTIEAFQKMVEEHVSGLAVVNGDGQVVGNISLRDLKGIHTDGRVFWRLYHPVDRFLAFLKEEFQKKHGIPKEVVAVTGSTTMREVIALMVKHRIHRVYVKNAVDAPAGVISIKDVLLEVIE
eukprot:TRINITY_DN305_c0_g1_i1.p1 TRINITY_DN305_c0_g1~~TRINITY_DN305_c0_g1_i1.p1  ORF type:complete len:355 (-),score=164.05 TRINITY_DN305_c0_g1_i1:395-1429(-)